MKVFGYSKEKSGSLLEMAEVSFLADPEQLRQVARLLLKAADQIEAGGKAFDHLQLRDEWRGWNANLPDVVVVNSNVYG